MTTRSPSMGQLVTMDPSYDRSTKVFTQCMTFRSAHGRIPSEASGYIVEQACETFAKVLAMNGLDDYAWPPDRVECLGHADAKGMLITLGTRADTRKPAILLQ